MAPSRCPHEVMELTIHPNPILATNAPKNRPQRVSRDREKHPAVVARAIPQGHRRAYRYSEWWKAILEHPEFAQLRSDSQRTLKRIADLLIWRTDRRTMTSRPTWKLLAKLAQVNRSTVARHIATLRSWGLLGVVATGRLGESVPGQPPTPNDAAVYVLCTPLPPPRQKPPVDGNRTPILLTEERRNNPTYARTRNAKPGLIYPGNAPVTAKTRTVARHRRILAAQEMQNRAFPLRKISARHLAQVCRPFFEAGWTLADVLKAIDQRPDGSPWPHDGATGIRNVAPWLSRRLSAWMPHGAPLPSASQLSRARSAQMAEQRRQVLAALEARRADAPAAQLQAKSGADLVRAAIRAAREVAARTVRRSAGLVA